MKLRRPFERRLRFELDGFTRHDYWRLNRDLVEGNVKQIDS